MTFSLAGADWNDLDNAPQKIGQAALDAPPRGHTTIAEVSRTIAEVAGEIRFCLSPRQQQMIALAARPGTEPTCEAAAKRLLVAAIMDTTGGLVGSRAEALALLARRCERRNQDLRTGVWLAWAHAPLTGRRAALALATLVRAGFLFPDRTGALRIRGFSATGTPTAHRAYVALLRWRQRAYVREADARRRLRATGRRVPTVLWHPEPELAPDGSLADRGRCRLRVPDCGLKRSARPLTTYCEAYRENRRLSPVAPPALPAEPDWLAEAPAPEPVPEESKVACPPRASGDRPVSDRAQPSAQAPAAPPSAEDLTAQVPSLAELRAAAMPLAGTDSTAALVADRTRVRGGGTESTCETKGDAAGAAQAPEASPAAGAEDGERVFLARDGRPNAGHLMAQVARRRAAECARRVAEEAAERARNPPVPAVTPRQGHTEGHGPDPRATVPPRRSQAGSAAPAPAAPERPVPLHRGRPATTIDWARLSTGHPKLEPINGQMLLATQVDYDLLRQAVDRYLTLGTEAANPTAYLVQICRRLMAERKARRP